MARYATSSETVLGRRLATFALVTSALALIGYLFFCLTRLRVTRLTFRPAEWPAELGGARIALLSDFHLGQLGTLRRIIAKAIEIADEFKPDLTVLAGDYFDGPISPANIAPLAGLRDHTAVIGVLGNHDYARGPHHLARTIAILTSLGVSILRNDSCLLAVNGRPLRLVGLDDPFTIRDDIEVARAGLTDDGIPTLLIAHAPVLSALGDLTCTALVLCGHTHGGQIRLLNSGRIPAKRLIRWLVGEHGRRHDPDFHRGVNCVADTPIVISDGLGVSLLPLRFRTRPHLILIEMNSSLRKLD